MGESEMIAGIVGCGREKSVRWVAVGSAQGEGSAVDPRARGGVELDHVRFGPRSKAIISAMLMAIKSIVPWSVATLSSSAAMQVASWAGGGIWIVGGGGAYTGGSGGNPERGRDAPVAVGSGKYVEGGPE
ncbi:hypothetical protein CRG98_016467 [Punica granatum]|uniref:Uncharacterized protein n=1 Tax=Punica granatum TaxID=22663 RepID=A0A2I0K3K6_PUNGR|nr:hypothetical protein CRG98_016467 [Punica granatum]